MSLHGDFHILAEYTFTQTLAFTRYLVTDSYFDSMCFSSEVNILVWLMLISSNDPFGHAIFNILAGCHVV
jgi:hypothetical protein